jgi:hypothetical protein
MPTIASFVATEELPGGHCSRVLANSTQVLKIPFQGEELTSGYHGMLALGELGPKIYDHDPNTATVLMERLRPGTALSSLPEVEAITVKIGLARRLRERSFDAVNLMPLEQYVDHSHPLVDRLLSTSPEPVFLHGDLHHENVLLHGSEWKIIDAKGLYGDPAYEPIAFLRNPISELATVENLNGLIQDRIGTFARELDLDPWRIWAWACVDLEALGYDEDAAPAWRRIGQLLPSLRP